MCVKLQIINFICFDTPNLYSVASRTVEPSQKAIAFHAQITKRSPLAFNIHIRIWIVDLARLQQLLQISIAVGNIITHLMCFLPGHSSWRNDCTGQINLSRGRFIAEILSAFCTTPICLITIFCFCWRFTRIKFQVVFAGFNPKCLTYGFETAVSQNAFISQYGVNIVERECVDTCFQRFLTDVNIEYFP